MLPALHAELQRVEVALRQSQPGRRAAAETASSVVLVSRHAQLKLHSDKKWLQRAPGRPAQHAQAGAGAPAAPSMLVLLGAHEGGGVRIRGPGAAPGAVEHGRQGRWRYSPAERSLFFGILDSK